VDAVADEAPAEDPEVRRAREHFQDGLRLVRRELWGPAAAEFEASLRLHQTGPALLNLALCLQRLQRYARALEAFEQYLRDYGAALSAPMRRRVQERAEEIRSMLASVEVFVDVGGATVLVDGERVGTSPLPAPLLLLSGQHSVEAQLEGHRTAEQVVWASPSEPQTVQLVLVPVPRQGLLRVTTSTPGARITIDDHPVDGPVFQGMVNEGPHQVVICAPGFRDRVEHVDVSAGGQLAMTLEPLPSRLVHRAWFWSALGLTIGGTLAMTALGTTALVLGGDYDNAALDAEAAWDRGHALMRATDATLGVTAALAVTTLVLSFFTEWPGRRAAEVAYSGFLIP